jgi:hypothetical protein
VWERVAEGGKKRRDLIVFSTRCGRAGGWAGRDNTDVWVRWAGTSSAGEKKLVVFDRNTLKIAIFWYFIVFSPYPLIKTYDGWVQREG